MMNDGTTAGATATSPTCGLTGCGVKVGKGGLCTGCRSVNYCSKEHQRRDWPSHKLKCRDVRVEVGKEGLHFVRDSGAFSLLKL